MTNRLAARFIYACSLATLIFGLSQGIVAQGQDRGESKENLALKNRSTAPSAADVDKGVTLQGLLSRKAEKDWAASKAAAIEGYIIQVEREEDGDYHIVLAANKGETDTLKWVITEVTRAWGLKKASLTGAQLRKLHGQKVRVTGWLYYEPDTESQDPRGTRWEIHPVTDITVSK